MKNIKVIALLVLVLVLALAACGGSEEASTDTTTEQETAVEDNAAPETEAEAETAVTLADEIRVDEGGYAFQPPEGYEVSVNELFAEMAATDNPDTQINIFGFPLMEGMGLDAMYEGFTAEFGNDEAISLSEREDITINGLDGFTATMSGEEDGVSLKGKIVVFGNEAQGIFVLAGAEESIWDGGVSEQTDAVVNSISLFEIALPELLVEEIEEPEAMEEAEDTDVEEEAPVEKANDEAANDFDTVFPIPADAANIIGEGGEGDLNFQTSLTIEEALEFYQTELTAQDLVERDLLTIVEESIFSIVFDGHESGKAIVVQGVNLGDMTNINIRFEET